MPYTPKEMAKLLEKNGFILINSNNGSHRKYYNKQSNITIILPFHTKELKKGLEHQILKEAGLK